MNYINEEIKKKYYFITDGVIYKISNRNDSDKCGICIGFNDDGTVKTDQELSVIFPFIKLTYSTYKIDKNGKKQIDKTGQEKYLWLQDFIYDGDKYNGGKFECTENLHDDGATTFLQRYINQTKDEIYEEIKNGYVSESLKNMHPKYFSGVPYEDFMCEDVRVTYVSLSSSEQILSDTNIDELFKKTAEIEAITTANRILKRNSQQVDNLTLTIKSL